MVRDEAFTINNTLEQYKCFVKNSYNKAIQYNSFLTDNTASSTSYNTNIIAFDIATGYNGIPKGELIEIIGETDTGKSALALLMVSAVQKSGGLAAYFDIEGKFHNEFAINIGVDIYNLFISNESIAYRIFDICEMLALGGVFKLIVIDSLTAMTNNPNSNYNLNNDDYSSYSVCWYKRGFRRLKSIARQTGCSIVILNQLRNSNDSIVNWSLALRSGLRLQLFKSSLINDYNDVIGTNLFLKIIKNNNIINRLSIWLTFYYSLGFVEIETLILNAKLFGVLIRKNDGLYYKDCKLGEDNFSTQKYLSKHIKLLESIKLDLKLICVKKVKVYCD